MPADSASIQADKPVDLTSLKPQLAALEDALKKRMSVARKQVQTLQPAFEGTSLATAFDDIVKAVSRLEFETALELLHQLDSTRS